MRTKLFLTVPALILGSLPLGAAGGEALAEAERLFDAAFGALDCTPCEEHECGASCSAAYEAGQKLPQLVSSDSTLLVGLAPRFRARFEEGGTAKDRSLGLLASSASKEAVVLGEELFRAAPASFSELHVLSFAEQGSQACAADLVERLGAEGSTSVLPAAWLAFEGDPAGKRVLLAGAAGACVDAQGVVDVLVSGSALGALGDERAFPAARERVHAAVLAALDRGELEAARAMALGAELLCESLTSAACGSTRGGGKSFRTSYLPEQVSWRVKQASAELATPDAVFELIERVIPVS